MRSEVPKPLHLLAGRPMVSHVLDALAGLVANPGPTPPPGPTSRPDQLHVVVVVGHQAERVAKTVIEAAPPGLCLHFVTQSARRGTGHAAAAALAQGAQFLRGDVLVLPADTPLLTPATLESLIAAHAEAHAAATVLTARPADPTGYGRVVRGPGHNGVVRIVEHADASPAEAAIDEVNTSIYCFDGGCLALALGWLDDANAQGELYLTDTIAILAGQGRTIASIRVDDPTEVAGVNDPAQLAAADQALRARSTVVAGHEVGVPMPAFDVSGRQASRE